MHWPLLDSCPRQLCPVRERVNPQHWLGPLAADVPTIGFDTRPLQPAVGETAVDGIPGLVRFLDPLLVPALAVPPFLDFLDEGQEPVAVDAGRVPQPGRLLLGQRKVDATTRHRIASAPRT